MQVWEWQGQWRRGVRFELAGGKGNGNGMRQAVLCLDVSSSPHLRLLLAPPRAAPAVGNSSSLKPGTMMMTVPHKMRRVHWKDLLTVATPRAVCTHDCQRMTAKGSTGVIQLCQHLRRVQQRLERLEQDAPPPDTIASQLDIIAPTCRLLHCRSAASTCPLLASPLPTAPRKPSSWRRGSDSTCAISLATRTCIQHVSDMHCVNNMHSTTITIKTTVQECNWHAEHKSCRVVVNTNMLARSVIAARFAY